jgi:hypothetical protein
MEEAKDCKRKGKGLKKRAKVKSLREKLNELMKLKQAMLAQAMQEKRGCPIKSNKIR